MKAKIICFLALFFVLAIAQGQSLIYTKGQVIGEGAQPLKGANISLLNPARQQLVQSLSDSAGWFVLAYSTKGKYAVVISHAGYSPHTILLEWVSDSHLGTIQLAPADTLSGVVVQSSQKLIEADAGTLTFNVGKSIIAQGASAFDALKKAPGVFIENESIITLNGKGGTLILLDGKQTYLSGKELIDLLRSMPSSTIRSIEISASPSAKYDAAGSGGIINIRTQKSLLKGFSGTVTTGLAYGITLKQSQDLSFHYRKGPYSLYGSYSHTVGHFTYEYGSDRQQNNRTYNSFTDDTDKRNKMATRLGLDFALTKRSTVGVLLTGNFVFGGGITRTTTGISKTASTDRDQTLYAVNDYYYQKTERYNLNTNYKYENEKGSQVNIDVDWGSFDKGNANLQSNAYQDAAAIPINQNRYRSFNDIAINLKAVKFDYTRLIAKGTLETGVKLSAVSTGNGARFFHVQVPADSLDEQRTNTFHYEEGVQSGYVNYKKTMGKWSFQGGVRIERTVSDGQLFFKASGADTTQDIKRSYTDVFPSFSVSVKPAADHALSLVYSRRIDRPAYQDLNPFIYLLDELSFWQGNPFLQPQLTHRAAVQWVYKSGTVLSAAYAHTDAFATRITDTLQGTRIVMIPRNLGVQKHLSLSLTHNLVFRKGWDATFSGVLFRLHNDIAFDAARQLELRQLAGRINFQQRIKLPYQMTGEIGAYYSSRRLAGANEISRGTSGIDLGLQKTLLNSKATLRLSVTDIYKGTRSRSEQRFSGFYLRSYGYYEARQVRLNFTYRFTGAASKGPRNRASALETENSRIK
jgi:hypothetical protein